MFATTQIVGNHVTKCITFSCYIHVHGSQNVFSFFVEHVENIKHVCYQAYHLFTFVFFAIEVTLFSLDPHELLSRFLSVSVPRK